jgi:hypothetical protein
LQSVVIDFRQQVRDSLQQNDALVAAQNKLTIDGDLPGDLRESLFLIRGQFARVAGVLDAENRLRRAVTSAARSVRALEALVAWTNGDVLERESPARDSRTLLQALNRSEDAIYRTRSLEKEAVAALPPDAPTPEAQFPALKKDVIVRIRGAGNSAAASDIVKCRQEVWRVEGWRGTGRRVRRTIVLVDIEPKSGAQLPASNEVKYYPIDPGETLEQIYDENAAQ